MADTAVRLEPGNAVSYPMAVHYHRVVGDLRMDGAVNDGVEVLIVDTAAWREHGDWLSAEHVDHVATGADARVLNHLIRCCDAVYTEYRLVVRNASASVRDVDLRAWAIHDDFAVVVDRAEPGAFGVPATIFGVLSAFALVFATRRRTWVGAARFPSTPSPGAQPRPVRGRASRALGWSIALAGSALAVAATLGIGGALRYGTDPVTGMISILADVPVPGGPFGSRAALVMGILLLAWCGAIAAWIRAVAVDRRQRVRAVGLSLGVVSLAGGIAMGVAYGALAVPGTLGLLLGIPLIVAAWLAGSNRGSPHARERAT